MVRFHIHSVISLLVAGAAFPVVLAAQNVSSVSPARDATSALSLSSSKWIWNSVTATAGAQVGLRKVFRPPFGKSLIAAEIIISSYINFQLYLNSNYVGTGNRSNFGHRFCVDLLPSYNVFAVNASTTVSGIDDGGLVATILVTYTDGTTDTLVTDSSWRAKGPRLLGNDLASFGSTSNNSLLDDPSVYDDSYEHRTRPGWQPGTPGTLGLRGET
ncbi:hypothetical protein C8F04DRAFT_1339285 [Mycena alexandri]|uniref:Lectin n=1 Tax=Mycena alexandri TaxID=1745969 RepID=A0AAD6RXT2_9AGAR|nr:hypothetical protein C8F04DRAFT_1339285 [Mycena alexandri]